MPSYYHTDTRPLWAFDADTHTLVHSNGYWIPLADHDQAFWMAHVGRKQWAAPRVMRDLERAYVSATQAEAA